MENSSLNKAHQHHRKAENHLKYRRFVEAIECHKTAADLLTDALANTQNPRSIECINLQIDFHTRQKNIILVKKEQFENYKRIIENHRNRLAYCNDYDVANDNQGKSLQVAIYHTMEATDSLLEHLIKKGGITSDSESCSTTDTDDKASSLDIIDSATPLTGVKHPKDDTTVIEELRTLNDQLHTLVSQLVSQLDASAKEVDSLKGKLKQLESEKSKAQIKSSTNNLKVVTDSSGGTSPFVFSPCSEFSPDVQDHKLPVLAPLEMPNFDFSNFVKNNVNSNANLSKI